MNLTGSRRALVVLRGFLGELEDRGAYSLIREHDHLRFTPQEATRRQVRPDGVGCVVSEQLEQPKARADGREGVKLRRIREMRCELNTLNYPLAAWFALTCAMVVFNVLGVVKAALRSAHGGEVQAKLSSHAMATHMRSMAQRLDDIVEPEDWRVFNEVSTPEMAQRLLEQTALVPLRYTKTPARKIAPKPAVKRAHDPKKPHVSLANPPPKAALEHRGVQQRPNHNLLDKYNLICSPA